MKALKYVLIVMTSWMLMACSTMGESSYNTGVAANTESNIVHQQTLQQQLTVNSKCFDKATDSVGLAICAMLQNGTVPVQTLGGKPAATRIAPSQGELAKEVISQALSIGGMAYGANQIGKAFGTAVGSAGKDPLVVRPEIVNPVIVGP